MGFPGVQNPKPVPVPWATRVPNPRGLLYLCHALDLPPPLCLMFPTSATTMLRVEPSVFSSIFVTSIDHYHCRTTMATEGQVYKVFLHFHYFHYIMFFTTCQCLLLSHTSRAHHGLPTGFLYLRLGRIVVTNFLNFLS